MNLAQASSVDDRGAGLLTKILQVQLLRLAEFRKDTSTHVHMVNKSVSTGTAARAEGGTLQKDAQVPSVETKTLQLYSRAITVDQLRLLDKNLTGTHKGLIEFYDRQLLSFATVISKEVASHMIKGTFANNQMLGLLEFIKDAEAAGQTARLGFTAAELAAMNVAAELAIGSVDGQDTFIEFLEEEIAKVPGANALVMNEKLAARFGRIARRLGASGETRDNYGRRVETYNGINIIRVPNTDLTNDQPDGVNNDNTSLFIVRFDETLGVCYSTNSGFVFKDFDHLEDAPQGEAVLSIYPSLTVEQQDAIKRVSQIRFAA